MEEEPQQDFNIDTLVPPGGIQIDESDRLKFAKQILLVLALICSMTFIAYARWPENAAMQAIFEIIKIGALPLVTLVISFYFPSNNSS